MSFEEFKIDNILIEELLNKQFNFSRKKMNSIEKPFTVGDLIDRLESVDLTTPTPDILVVYEVVYYGQKNLLEDSAFYSFGIRDDIPTNTLMVPIVNLEYHGNVLILRTTEENIKNSDVLRIKEISKNLLNFNYQSFEYFYKFIIGKKGVSIPRSTCLHVGVFESHSGADKSFLPIWNISNSFSYHKFLDPNY
jgi:hypothetical protein